MKIAIYYTCAAQVFSGKALSNQANSRTESFRELRWLHTAGIF